MLNPVFSLANMRELLPIIQPIANELTDVLRSRLLSGKELRFLIIDGAVYFV